MTIINHGVVVPLGMAQIGIRRVVFIRLVYFLSCWRYISISKRTICKGLSLGDEFMIRGSTNIEVGVDLYRFVAIDLKGVQIIIGDIWIRLGYLHYFGFDSVVPDGVKNPHFE